MDLDLNKYYAFVGRMKVTPAFDGVDLSNGENNLFGTAIEVKIKAKDMIDTKANIISNMCH